MSEGLIHKQNRISQAKKMRMLNKQTLCKPWTRYTQKAEEQYTKQTKGRIYKDTTRSNTEQCRGFIMGCYRNMEQ
jgi:hypothetical protein